MFTPSADDERTETLGVIAVDLAPRGKTALLRWATNSPLTRADIQRDQALAEAWLSEHCQGWTITRELRIADDPLAGHRR